MRTDDSPRSRSRSPQLPSRREDQARYSVEVSLLSEPTVPKHSSQGSVYIDETTVNRSNPSNIDEASECPRDLWLSILQQQVECHANKLDSFEEAVRAILRAYATDAERRRTIERRSHEQMKTIQQEMQSLQCEYQTHVEQFRLRIVDTWKHATEMHTSLANRLDKVQNSLQNCRIASAARPDWNRH
mgnify:CR=1 FL=1